MDEDAAVVALERVAARELGRGSAALAMHTAGSLRRAATSLLSTQPVHAVVVTGFFIPAAEPPAAETDGPPGAVALAAAILALGGTVRILTDEPCESVVRAAIRGAELAVPLDVAPLTRYSTWEGDLLSRYGAVTHAIAVERPGPAADGTPYNMRGIDVSPYTAPLERVYLAGAWTRIGIGDGGNELGMGALPTDVVANVVPLGARIHCAVGCDALIVGGTSNWGAAALVAALAVLAPDRAGTLGVLLRPEWSETVLRTMVADGAVDGMLRRSVLSVDGLSWPEYADTLREIERITRTVTR